MNFKTALSIAALLFFYSCGDVPRDNPYDPGYESRVQPCTSAPTIASLNPTSGSSNGGYTVTITGTNLSSISSVTFGEVQAVVTSRSSTQAIAIAPSHQAGTVTVTVDSTCGSSSLADSFTYIP